MKPWTIQLTDRFAVKVRRRAACWMTSRALLPEIVCSSSALTGTTVTERQRSPAAVRSFRCAAIRTGAFAGGLGLGLAIVRNLVKHHDGRVWAESEGRGHGSTFRVELPLLEDDHEQAPAAPAKQGTLGALRVMVVDDNEDARVTLGWMLRLGGCTVLELGSGSEALVQAPSFDADIAVLDLGMPEMDGMTLARYLRAALGEQAPKLVALTGYGQPADRARAQEAGFDAYLVKPVDPEELQRTIQRLRGVDPG